MSPFINSLFLLLRFIRICHIYEQFVYIFTTVFVIKNFSSFLGLNKVSEETLNIKYDSNADTLKTSLNSSFVLIEKMPIHKFSQKTHNVPNNDCHSVITTSRTIRTRKKISYVLLKKLPLHHPQQLNTSIESANQILNVKTINSCRKRKIDNSFISPNVVKSKSCEFLPELYTPLEKFPRTSNNEESKMIHFALNCNNSNLNEEINSYNTSSPRSVNSEILKLLGDSCFNDSSKKSLTDNNSSESFQIDQPVSSTPVKNGCALVKEDLRISDIQKENFSRSYEKSLEIPLLESHEIYVGENINHVVDGRSAVEKNGLKTKENTQIVNFNENKNNFALPGTQINYPEQNNSGDNCASEGYAFDFPELNNIFLKNKVINCYLPVLNGSALLLLR